MERERKKREKDVCKIDEIVDVVANTKEKDQKTPPTYDTPWHMGPEALIITKPMACIATGSYM